MHYANISLTSTSLNYKIKQTADGHSASPMYQQSEENYDNASSAHMRLDFSTKT